MNTQKFLLKQRYLTICLSVIMGGGFATQIHAKGKESKVSLPAITVYAEHEKQASSLTSINKESLEQTGVQNMADVVKYLPLVKAPFSVYGGGSYMDSPGTSSINIRGLDANRIGLDIDGIDVAEAAISPYIPAASMSKRGAGRDYIEPEMLQSVDIASGTVDASIAKS